MKKLAATFTLFLFLFSLINLVSAQELLPRNHPTAPLVSELNDGFTMILSEDIMNEARTAFGRWNENTPDYFRVYQSNLGGEAMKAMIDLNSIGIEVNEMGWILNDGIYINRWDYKSYSVGVVVPAERTWAIWVIYE